MFEGMSRRQFGLGRWGVEDIFIGKMMSKRYLYWSGVGRGRHEDGREVPMNNGPCTLVTKEDRKTA